MSEPKTLSADKLKNLSTHGPLTKGYNLARHQDMTTYSVVDPENNVHLADDQGHAFVTIGQAKNFAITRRWTRRDL